MLFKTLNGRQREISITPYRIDWDHVVSRPQKRIKDFLYPFWRNDTVCEELRLAGTKLRADIVNISRLIMVEVSPLQHQQYNAHFHRSIAGFRASLKRDLAKERWCELNSFTYCELVAEDLNGELSEQLFLDRFGVTL